ncbi:putative glycosyltransferase [Bacillus sp. TS-2]|nr:putative glycosyltransferase [Bacillus sp. TS-2]
MNKINNPKQTTTDNLSELKQTDARSIQGTLKNNSFIKKDIKSLQDIEKQLNEEIRSNKNTILELEWINQDLQNNLKVTSSHNKELIEEQILLKKETYFLAEQLNQEVDNRIIILEEGIEVTNELKETNQKLTYLIDWHNQDIVKKEKHSKNLNKQILSVQKENRIIQTKISKVHNQSVKIKKDIERLELIRKKSQKDYVAIKRTKLWRLSAPIRILLDKLRSK